MRSNIRETLTRAINERRTVILSYGGRNTGERICNPHILYLSTQNTLCVDCYQIAGKTSKASVLPAWRPFNTEDISPYNLQTRRLRPRPDTTQGTASGTASSLRASRGPAMKLESLHVQNYRSLKDVMLAIGDLTTLIGANGSGKSSCLSALRLLFDPRAHVDARDFWRDAGAADVHDPTEPIVIRASFSELSDQARAAYEPFLTAGSALALERVFEGPGPGTYVGYRRTVAEFAMIRNSATGHRDQFNKLVTEGQFEGLSKITSKQAALDQMVAWEDDHPDRLEPMPERVSFFTDASDMPTAIGNYIRLFHIGALEDPHQHIDPTRGGAVAELVAEVFEESAVLAELADISDGALTRSNKILEEANASFESATRQIANSLRDFAPGFSVQLRWRPLSASRAQSPSVSVIVSTSEGLQTELEYQGHGVQRSLMYGVLTAQTQAGSRPSSGRTLLLAIEEPEAFQHPLSARVLSDTLARLAAGPFQIIYSTHSPYFIKPRDLGGLRLVRRVQVAPSGMETMVEPFSIEDFTVRWRTAVGSAAVSEESTSARLRANASPAVIEGLFAQACVIVEGDEDEALLRAGAAVAEVDLDRRGIAVVQSRGKAGMPLVFAFLTHAGIACYPMFDLDRSQAVENQHRDAERHLASLLGLDDEASFEGDAVQETFAHWHDDFGKAVARELGERYTAILQDVCDELGYALRQGRKVSAVLASALATAFQEGLRSPLLDALVDRVQALVPLGEDGT